MEVSLTLPTELSDIKIWQIHEYEQLDKTGDEVDLMIQLLSIFCEVPTAQVRQMPYKTLVYCAQKLTEALGKKPNLVRTFTWEGQEYGFVPNLDDITTGEFIDIESYQKNKGDLWKLLCVLYRPIVYRSGNKYRIAEYEGNLVTSFKDLNAEIGYGALLFFWTLGTDLLNFTLKYLATKTEKTSTNLTNNQSAESGDGLLLYTHLLKGMYSELMTLQGANFILAYNGLPMSWTYKRWKKNSLKNQNENGSN